LASIMLKEACHLSLVIGHWEYLERAVIRERLEERACGIVSGFRISYNHIFEKCSRHIFYSNYHFENSLLP
jgi:hypothetical protein